MTTSTLCYKTCYYCKSAIKCQDSIFNYYDDNNCSNDMFTYMSNLVCKKCISYKMVKCEGCAEEIPMNEMYPIQTHLNGYNNLTRTKCFSCFYTWLEREYISNYNCFTSFPIQIMSKHYKSLAQIANQKLQQHNKLISEKGTFSSELYKCKEQLADLLAENDLLKKQQEKTLTENNQLKEHQEEIDKINGSLLVENNQLKQQKDEEKQRSDNLTKYLVGENYELNKLANCSDHIIKMHKEKIIGLERKLSYYINPAFNQLNLVSGWVKAKPSNKQNESVDTTVQHGQTPSEVLFSSKVLPTVASVETTEISCPPVATIETAETSCPSVAKISCPPVEEEKHKIEPTSSEEKESTPEKTPTLMVKTTTDTNLALLKTAYEQLMKLKSISWNDKYEDMANKLQQSIQKCE